MRKSYILALCVPSGRKRIGRIEQTGIIRSPAILSTLALWPTPCGNRYCPMQRSAVAGALGLNVDDGGRWVAFWAALHDLGKLSPAFQSLDEVGFARVKEAGFPAAPLSRHPPHGLITTMALSGLLAVRWQLDRPLAADIATVVGGHHGTLPSCDAVYDVAAKESGVGAWARARLDLGNLVAVALDVPPAIPRGRLDNATAMVLAGLISVSDWIGSNVDRFPLACDGTPVGMADSSSDYTKRARRQADEALQLLGWKDVPAASERRSFGELFPSLPPPNPVQEEIIELADRLVGPSLVLIEVPMGEGKTEAALYLADRGATALGQRGSYVALPTQATSNQMFARVREFLEHRYAGGGVDLQLLHGHADLSAEFAELRANGDKLFRLREVSGEKAGDGAPAAVVAAEWFTHRKRGLLSPFGVGTVDQVLLAALQTKHVFVRLFGLAHKTVIVDEVHAYDAYMSTLLERLLEWLAALGTSVVLLSATLPNARRAGLVAAFARGRGSKNSLPPPPTDYPRVTWTSDAGSGAATVGTSPRSAKVLTLVHLDGNIPTELPAPFPLAGDLRSALDEGGCVAVICNTVRRAQAMYLALKAYFPGDADDGWPVLGLLHARYLFEERDRREKRALIRFGKPGGTVVVDDGEERPVRRPNRAVLVATQIVEQSLDLDFDLMVTDLAPVDLLLQRSGRLWRHNRKRPSHFGAPSLWILDPPVDENRLPVFDRGTAKVYDVHVLLRTWLALVHRSTLRVPEDVGELVESVYDERFSPDDSDPELRRRWEASSTERADDLEAERQEAKTRWLKQPSFGGPLWELAADSREEDAPNFHQAHQALTRLTEPSVSVVCLYGTDDAPFFDRDNLIPIDLTTVPTVAIARRLLERSVNVSDKSIVFILLKRAVPPGWVKSPLLRHYRIIAFNAQGHSAVDGVSVRLDPDLGFVVEGKEVK